MKKLTLNKLYTIIYGSNGGKMYKVILIIVCILLIAIVLLQSGKAESAAGAFTGGNENLFANRKVRGELFISRLTFVLGIIFFILCMYKGF